MRVLFLENNPMWIYGLPKGFCDAGHTVIVSGPLTSEGLNDMISNFQPDLIFTMGHTSEHTPEKQKMIKEYVSPTKIPHVYWATEDPGYTLTFSLPLIQTIKPDFVFTICPSRVDFYKDQQIPAAHLDFGYHSSVHFPDISEKYEVSLAVVANGYPMLYETRPDHYRFKALRSLLSPFLEEDIRIDFWGRYWDQMEHILGKKIPDEWIHGFLPYTEANKVYSSADFVLGVQNHDSQVTQRTYEVLGSGGLLLTNDTSEIRRLFSPGQDLLSSNSSRETIELVKYYLRYPEERTRIKKAGMESVKKYSFKNRAEYVINTLIDAGILSKGAESSGTGEFIHYVDKLKENYEIYVIQPKDTLWSISRKFGVSVDELKQLNNLKTDIILVNHYLKVKKK
ncbi:glycosyltransferase family protein [Neobacillus ginsengisoli]|uniref:Spore maturation protein CgeB n=1 Tax=Neobacillus ginsengisoli TaxID=904295 RepID=A0ABT9Y0E5_9BACI|nr:glycosyltransferase [Neobacillus ginsengisoli]MDQ0200985.1 spore maturation protein CgeB [Neobacillus ginsengisoli]